MTNPSIDPEILQDFLTECGELLDELESDLVELEQRPADTDLINRVFRALHTIKGSGSFLQLTNLVEIAHAAETALNEARGNHAVINEAFMSMVFEAVDVLRGHFAQLSNGSTDLAAPDPTLVAGLVDVASGAPPALEPEPPTETAAEPPIEPGSTAGPAPADGERRLELPDSKAELLDDFVNDLNEQLASVADALEDLASAADRAPHAEAFAALGRDLESTIDFFDCSEMLDLARSVTSTAAAAAELEADSIDQLVPRWQCLLDLLNRQTEALRRGVVITPPCGEMLERVHAIAAGRLQDDWRLPPGCGPEEALLIDAGSATATTTPEPAAPAVSESPAGPLTEASAARTIEPSDAAAPDTPAEEQHGSGGAAIPPSPAGVEPGAAAPSGGEPPAEAAGQASAQSGQGSSAPEQTIRVEIGRLETLMNQVGELVLQKNRIVALFEQVRQIEGIAADLSEQVELSSSTLDRVTGDIQVAVMRTRMQPLDKLFGKYPRLIRDLAQKTGKKIRLNIEGGETEVDKSVLEELGDPLVHLLRNSADHGLEGPEGRLASGKPETGVITLRASHEGNHVRILIIDDGRGLNREAIARKAVENGVIGEQEVASLTDEDVHKLIFMPGFSTAEQVSDLSGRGVGMDVVRTNIENLKGSITVASEPGRGTRFEITIPLTVAIMPAMMIRIAGERFAVPLNAIVEIVRPEPQQLSTIVEGRVIRLRERVLPVLDGAQAVGLSPAGEGEAPVAVVLGANDKRVALLIAEVLGQQEIVVKPLSGVSHGGAVSGATVRNDGGVSLILDVAELIRRAG